MNFKLKTFTLAIASILIGFSQNTAAFEEQIATSMQINRIKLDPSVAVIEFNPAFNHNQNCFQSEHSRVVIDRSNPMGEDLLMAALTAAQANKEVSITIDGCSNGLLLKELTLAPSTNNLVGIRMNSPATDDEPVEDPNSEEPASDPVTPTEPANTTLKSGADGHEYSGIFAEEYSGTNKVWIGKPVLGGGAEYSATLTIGPLNIEEGQGVKNASLTWKADAGQAGYKFLNFNIQAVTNLNTNELGSDRLPSQQPLTNARALVKTGEWAGASSSSYWVPRSENIDLTEVIQEITKSDGWINNSYIQLVMTPAGYPAGTGFIGFNSEEGSSDTPSFSYSLANSDQVDNGTGSVEDPDQPEDEYSAGDVVVPTDPTPADPEPTPAEPEPEQPTDSNPDGAESPYIDPMWNGFELVSKQLNWFTWRGSALPDVTFDPTKTQNAYRAEVTENSNNQTLHFNREQGRLDAATVSFPFEVVVRNVGIRDFVDEQSPPPVNVNAYIFAGVQIHTLDSNEASSAHVVVGHRGYHPLTIEGKTTVNGKSVVNDIGASAVPMARADLKIVGNADRSISVYWQQPNLSQDPLSDSWSPYYPNGVLPGTFPSFGPEVAIGLITYGYLEEGVPFIGTADRIEIKEFKKVSP